MKGVPTGKKLKTGSSDRVSLRSGKQAAGPAGEKKTVCDSGKRFQEASECFVGKLLHKFEVESEEHCDQIKMKAEALEKLMDESPSTEEACRSEGDTSTLIASVSRMLVEKRL